MLAVKSDKAFLLDERRGMNCKKRHKTYDYMKTGANNESDIPLSGRKSKIENRIYNLSNSIRSIM